MAQDGTDNPAVTGDTEAMTRQFEAARAEAERRFAEYQRQIAAELARNVTEAFGTGAPGAAPPTLESAPVADLHRLQQADSHVRHSIVEACFYNLRLYGDLLLNRRDKPGFREKLQANLDQLPAIRDELADYFALPVGGRPLAAYFAEQDAVVSRELAVLSETAADLADRYDDEPRQRRFAETVPPTIDRIMTALGEITAHLRGIKVDLVSALQQVVALHEDRLSAQGVSVRFTNKNGEAAPVFGDRRELMNAFGELIKNAAKHGLAGLPAGRPKVIGIVLRLVTLTQQTYQIDVADSGRGIPDVVRDRLGVRGVTTGGTGEGFAMVRQIIEDRHLGSLAVLSREGTGTLIRLHLPRSLARPVKPDA